MLIVILIVLIPVFILAVEVQHSENQYVSRIPGKTVMAEPNSTADTADAVVAALLLLFFVTVGIRDSVRSRYTAATTQV